MKPFPKPIKKRSETAIAKFVENPNISPITATLTIDMTKHGLRPHLSDAIPQGKAAIVRPIIKAPVIQPAEYPALSTLLVIPKSTTINATKGSGEVKTTE
jgi:hypothetical protein